MMNMKKKKVMIADDEKDIVTLLTMMLEDAGYEVRSTSDGQTAKIVGEFLPDVILLDIWMAGIDGRDVCKYLKSQKRTKTIPVIMVSANQDTKKIALEAGANDFIAKPFDMDVLLEKIALYA